MSITVRDGFILLSSYDRPERIEYVKGSAVSRVTTIQGKTLVTLGLDAGWSIEVREKPDEVIEAVARSYSQVARR